MKGLVHTSCLHTVDMLIKSHSQPLKLVFLNLVARKCSVAFSHREAWRSMFNMALFSLTKLDRFSLSFILLSCLRGFIIEQQTKHVLCREGC